MKLENAKKRREEMDRIREITLQDKSEQVEQALLRAQENTECTRERLRKETCRVAKVNARRNLMERKERERVLASIENKLNGALTRAEEISERRQVKARNRKRVERAKRRRDLMQFERKTSLLSTVEIRSEQAHKNVELMLKDRQCKARGEIEHVHRISRRVRAARVLQRAVRKSLFGVSRSEVKDDSTISQVTAAIRFQHWATWRANVACRRLVSAREETCEESSAPLADLKLILSSMGLVSSGQSLALSFEILTSEMSKDETLAAAQSFLSAFEPIWGMNTNTVISERTFLSAFLVAQQPLVVLGPKRDSDTCSHLLDGASQKLVKALVNLASGMDENPNQCAALVTRAASCLVSYCTLFDKWKNADIDDLVKQMKKSATQSWIAYITANEALAYAEEKEGEVGKEHGDPLFQYKIRYKPAKRGAASHIKRIRASLDKLLGPAEGLRVMKLARQSAMSRIEEDGLTRNAKEEVDAVCEVHVEKTQVEIKSGARFDLNDQTALENVNEHVVHEILLTDHEDLRERLNKKPDASVVDSVEGFMKIFRNSAPDPNAPAAADDFTVMMERAFFDSLSEDWISNNNIKGVQEMLLEIFTKMRNLVPRRQDLHGIFTDTHANGCKDATDVLALLTRVADIMGDSLESEYRSQSTLQWLKVTTAYGNGTMEVPYQFPDVKSFVVVSMAFIVKKLDLCHADLVDFRLGKVTPLICQNGVFYERQRFQQKHGASTEGLHATRSWIRRLDSALPHPSTNLSAALKKGFVDELLFVRERISMPEVLALDATRISSIRERAQRTVICSALFLHMCTLTKRRISSLQSNAMMSKVKYHKEEVMKSLKSNLPFEELHINTSTSLVAFAEGMLGQPWYACLYQPNYQ